MVRLYDYQEIYCTERLQWFIKKNQQINNEIFKQVSGHAYITPITLCF